MTVMPRLLLTAAIAAAIGIGAVTLAGAALPPDLSNTADAAQARSALALAVKEGKRAKYRAERLEEDARRATERLEKTANEQAAVAARIQETEARIAARQAQLRLMAQQRGALSARLAERQEPLIRLSAALQRLARRPPVLGLLRPGSVRDTVYLRALLETMLPQVEARTRALRVELARLRDLADKEALAAAALKREEARLGRRQQQLSAMETQQRLESRRAAGVASREKDRALALAERASDLEGLVTVVGEQGRLRRELAALPGPIMRPPSPEESRVVVPGPSEPSAKGLASYILPVAGRLVTGFGEASTAGRSSRGIVLSARGGAQVVAPAEGRVAFAGPYRGFGRIVIVEHESGWTSLVTGLARLDVEVGDKLVAGSPLGVVEPSQGQVRLELRKDGEPVNPLRYLKSL